MLSEDGWNDLVDLIERGRCIPVLGPKLVKDKGDPAAACISEILAEQLQNDLPEAAVPRDFRGALPLIGQLWVSYGNMPGELQSRVTRSYAERTGNCQSTIHQELARLPFHLCLTTTPDHFMADAFRSCGLGKDPVWVYYDHSKSQKEKLGSSSNDTWVPAGTSQKPLVFGLMGGVEDKFSVIVEECDVLDSLFEFQRGSGRLPSSVTSELSAESHAFLFMGFDLERCYARLLVRALRRNRPRIRSLGVMPYPAEDNPDYVVREEPVGAEDYFKIVHSIEIQHTDWLAFATELRQRFEKKYRSGKASAKVPKGAPRVFLCHDSRDRVLVARFEAQLHQSGVDTWRDQNHLRGGDNWERRIPIILRKQADYVVVCLTPHMIEPGEKYFRLEIEYALERQVKWGDTKFLIPVLLQEIGDGQLQNGLEQLDTLNRRDLTKPDGFEGLLDDISEDWANRPSKTGTGG
jgi:hypothetical protein